MAPRLKLLRPLLEAARPRLDRPRSQRFGDPARASAAARGYGAAWRRLRDEVLERDGYVCRCSECRALGRVLEAHEVDHVIPKALGGTDDLGNLQAINGDCHRRKSQAEAAAARAAM